MTSPSAKANLLEPVTEPELRVVNRWVLFALAVVAAGIGIRATGSAVFVGDGTHWVSMKTVTAVGVVLAALSLWFKGQSELAEAAPWHLSVARVLSGILAAMGALILLAHATTSYPEWQFLRDALSTATDRALNGALDGVPESAPQRASDALTPLLAGISFLVFGLAFLMPRSPRLLRSLDARQALFIAALSIAGFELIGMLFIKEIPDGSIFRHLALPSAVALVGLALGGLFLTPRSGLLGRTRQRTPAGIALRNSLLSAVGIPLVLGYISVQLHRSSRIDVELVITLFAVAMLFALVAVGYLSSKLVERTDSGASAILAAAPGAMIVVDSGGIIRRANLKAAAVFGYGDRPLIGVAVDELVPMSARGQHRAHRHGFERNGVPRAMGEGRELRGRRLDGSEFEIEVSLSPLESPGGQLVVCAIDDVTERRRELWSLHESEQRFRQAFESAAVGFAIVGLGGEWIRLNEAMCRLLGYRDEELRAMTFADVTHPEDIDGDLDLVGQLLRGEIPRYELGKRYIRKDGVVVWAHLSAQVVRDVAGQPLYFVAIIQDVSESHHAASAARASLAEKETLLREIHHRVKNNLQVISSILNLQANSSASAEVHKQFDTARQRVRTMAMVHERLYRSERLTTIDVTAHLRELAELQHSAHQDANQSVVLDFSGEPFHVSIDIAIPLGLIANELVDNAFKHGLQGRSGGTLRVQIERLGEDRGRISVSNDGAEIDPALDLDMVASLGLRLVRALLPQVQGALDIQRGPQTSFSLTFQDAVPMERNA